MTMNFERGVPEVTLEQDEKKVERIWSGEIDFSELDEPSKEFIRKCASNPENFLGLGGAGKVFDLESSCIKIMENRHRSPNADKLKLGNSVAEEAEIQNKLRDLVVSGVFAPRIFGFYEGEKSVAIIMERLDAINLQFILNGEEEFPEEFDLDDFIEALGEYVDEMHKLGIIHRDLEARNVMVDRKTGLPRVIDFGRSVYAEEELDKFDKMKREDTEKIDDIYDKIYKQKKEKIA